MNYDFYDIHAHVYKYQYPINKNRMLFITYEQLKRTHKKLNIKKAVLLPIVSPEIYVPQSVGEIIDCANQSDGMYIPFCNIDPRVLTNTSDAPIGNLIEHYKKLGCKGIGEIMPNLPWNDARMHNLLYHTEKANIPLLFDMTGKKGYGYGIYDSPGMPLLRECLEKYSNLTFIGHGPAFWSEISTLRNKEDFIGYPDYPIDNEGTTIKFMREYKNLHVDLSANSGFNALNRDLTYAKKFLNEFSDRILYGTDICYEEQSFATANLLISFYESNKINEKVFNKISKENFRKMVI